MIFEILFLITIFFIPIAGCGRKKRSQLPPGANMTLVPPCAAMATDSRETTDSRDTTRSENKEGVAKAAGKKPEDVKKVEEPVEKPEKVNKKEEKVEKTEEKREKTGEVLSTVPQTTAPVTALAPKTDETVNKKSAEKTAKKSVKKSMEKPKTDMATANELEEEATQKEHEPSLEPTQVTGTIEKSRNEEASMMKTDDKTQEKSEETRKPHVSIDPEQLEWQSEEMEVKTLKIANCADKKVMFKIKSSDNAAYQVNPVFGTIDAGQTSELTITHSKGVPKEDKLVVLNSLFSGDQKDLAQSFRTAKPTGEPLTVKMIAK